MAEVDIPLGDDSDRNPGELDHIDETLKVCWLSVQAVAVIGDQPIYNPGLQIPQEFFVGRSDPPPIVGRHIVVAVDMFDHPTTGFGERPTVFLLTGDPEASAGRVL